MKNLLLQKKQILFFIIAGALSAMVEIGAFKMLSVSVPKFFPHEKNLYGISFPLSNVLSTTCVIITNYFLSIWFVFERWKYSKRREFAYFMFVSFLSTVLSLSFFQIFYNFIFLDNFNLVVYTLSPEVISKISAIILVSILNYTVKKKVIFNG